MNVLDIANKNYSRDAVAARRQVLKRFGIPRVRLFNTIFHL